MSKGRYTSRRRRNTLKPLLIAMAVVLLIGCVAGGTLAWLKVETDPVENTFTVGNIDITLVETTSDYKMVPGNEIEKDPLVTVVGGSEACWLFVQITETDNLDDFIEYTVAEGWTELTKGSNIYYREVAESVAVQEFAVLKDNKVTVKEDVDKAMMGALTNSTLPKLTFKAYAVQKDNVDTAADAWRIANTSTT